MILFLTSSPCNDDVPEGVDLPCILSEANGFVDRLMDALPDDERPMQFLIVAANPDDEDGNDEMLRTFVNAMEYHGIGIGDVGKEVIKDRERLSGGAILIGITISRKRKAVLAGPEIEMRGLAYLKETEPIRREIAKIAETALQEGLRKSVPDLNQIKGEIYDKSVRYLRGRCQMEPMILPLLVEVA